VAIAFFKTCRHLRANCVKTKTEINLRTKISLEVNCGVDALDRQAEPFSAVLSAPCTATVCTMPPSAPQCHLSPPRPFHLHYALNARLIITPCCCCCCCCESHRHNEAASLHAGRDATSAVTTTTTPITFIGRIPDG